MISEKNITSTFSAEGEKTMQSTNPRTRAKMPESFPIASVDEVDRVVDKAHNAWRVLKKTSGIERANFLRAIAAEIENLGDRLVQQVMDESGLLQGRVIGERGRTCSQLRLFADLLEEGSWVDAVIDKAIPERKPIARADIRKMSIAIGPVAVFTASNFPLAFSTAGGDTASALAAACPVIVKAHPSHLGTNALVTEAIKKAAQVCELPDAVFSSLSGDIETGQHLVKHPLVRAVGFTGSFQGGKAIFDLANSRAVPIPVYAEMGSNNPIFILPGKLKNDCREVTKNIASSVNLGAGQFCTNPGILVLQESEMTDSFLQSLREEFSQMDAATMLNEGIFEAFNAGKTACLTTKGVSLVFENSFIEGEWSGRSAFATVSARDFLQNKILQEEVFGPFTLVVLCKSENELRELALELQGQLTVSIIGTTEELGRATDLIELLSEKAGRVIFNEMPTGVEVCAAMHHGGPFPSTTSPLYTSVGTDAIKRFVRPVVFQNAPDDLLPLELKNANPLAIWRTVNGEKVKA